MSLHRQPILVVAHEIDQFVLDLHVALVGMGAEAMIALSEEKAIDYAARFEFSAVLIPVPTHFDKGFIDAFGGVPVIFYGHLDNVVPITKSWVTVRQDVPDILHALERTLRRI